VRGRVAALLVLGAVVALVLIHFRSTGGGGGGSGGWQIQYSYQSPGWSARGLILSAVALACAGVVLWTARARHFVALATVLALAGAGALAWTISTPNDTRISPADYRAANVGMSESLLTSQLGSPYSTDGSATRRGTSIGCLMYLAASSSQPMGGSFAPTFPTLAQAIANSTAVTGLGASNYLFCFDHDQLTVKSAS